MKCKVKIILGILLFVFVLENNNTEVQAGTSPEFTIKQNETGDAIIVTITKQAKYEKYVIQMKSDYETELKKIKTINETGTGTCSYTIKNLSPGTYRIRVKAKDGYYYDYSKLKRITLNEEAQGNNILINSELFSDDSFRKWICTNIDKDGDGQLSEDEINNTEEIFVSDTDIIFSFKGIEVFKNLKKFSAGDRGYIGKLDLSKNLKLEEIYCYDAFVTKLKVGKNKALRKLYCGKNEDLKSLDLKYAIALEELDCHGCKRLESLNICNAKALKSLDCYKCDLNSLNINKSISLESLELRHNKYLKSLDLSNNKALVELFVSFSGVKDLDLSKNTSLKLLYYSSDQSYMIKKSNYPSDTMVCCDSEEKTSSPYKYWLGSDGKIHTNRK